MLVSATVRVRPAADGEEVKPDRWRLQKAAELLKESGFDILRVGRFGVCVRAHDTAFSQMFGVKPKPNHALAMNVTPSDPQLRDLVDLLEVTSEPQLY